MEPSGIIERSFGSEDDLLVQDNTHLLRFLPADIWQQVIEGLQKRHTHNALENLTNSSCFYRNSLDNQKTLFLFGNVLNVLVKGNYISKLKDVLNCRKVCKAWTFEIDKILTNDSSKMYLSKISEFGSYAKIVKFYVHFNSTHTNGGRSPFIGNKVNLTIDNYAVRGNNGPADRLLNRHQLKTIARFLYKYRSHIKIFSTTFDLSDNLLLKDVLVRFRKWLLPMKNLVILRVMSRMAYLCKNDLEHGKPFLQRPFPKLDKLKELHINKCFPEDVGLNIVQNNNHIRKLVVEMNWTSYINYDYKLSDFPDFSNLNHLDINVNSIGKMEDLKNANFPHLTTLTLNSRREYNFDVPIRWSEIFSIIETKFGDTLERLSVEMESHDSQVLSDTTSFRLNLTKLKEIRLLVNGTQFSLDFILPMMNSLEPICVMVISSQTLEGSVIKMSSFQDFKVWNADKLFEFIHFDKGFGEIKDWIRDETTIPKWYKQIIRDKLLLRSVCVF